MPAAFLPDTSCFTALPCDKIILFRLPRFITFASVIFI